MTDIRAENERPVAELAEHEERARASALTQARMAEELERVTREHAEKRSWDATVAEEFYHVFAAVQRIWDFEVLHPQELLPKMHELKARATAAEAALALRGETVARLRGKIERLEAEAERCESCGINILQDCLRSLCKPCLREFEGGTRAARVLAETAPADGGRADG